MSDRSEDSPRKRGFPRYLSRPREPTEESVEQAIAPSPAQIRGRVGCRLALDASSEQSPMRPTGADRVSVRIPEGRSRAHRYPALAPLERELANVCERIVETALAPRTGRS